MAADTVILGVIIGTLAAIVYSLRVLILLERRIARMDLNIEVLTQRILREELKIEREERLIEKKLGIISKKPAKKKKPVRAKIAKKTTKKKVATGKTGINKKATRKKVVKKATKKKVAKRKR